MKQIKIESLKISNFKGIHELLINFDGKNFNIYGANGAGKTTIFDAFCWCLFGKDSLNQSDFEIKTIVNGEPMHKGEHEVEVVLTANNLKRSFRRTFSEKWTKPRGQLDYAFNGHKTEYYIDNEPITQRKFNEEVSTLIDPKVFMLLSNPLYFNETLKWEQRRAMLLEICGDISFEGIINSNKELAPLLKYETEEVLMRMQKIAKNSMGKIAKQIADIPARISELQRVLPPNYTGDVKAYEIKVLALGDQIKVLKGKEQEAVANLSCSSGNIDKAYRAYIEAKETEDASREEKIAEARNKYNELAKEEPELNNKVGMAKYKIEQVEREIRDLERAKENATTEYTQCVKSQFEVKEIETTCPTCGKDLDAEVIERTKAQQEVERKKFNSQKAHRLEEIVQNGVSLATKIKGKQEELAGLKEELSNAQSLLEGNHNLIHDASCKFKNAAAMTYSDDVRDLKQKWESLVQNEQKTSKATIETAIKPFVEEINKLEEQLAEVKKLMAEEEANEKTFSRIRELEKEEADLNRQHEDFRVLCFLCEKYTRRKIDFVAEKVKGKFQIADFKLFKENISNDGIEECCEITVKDVPYRSVNSAMRINVGMDVISTLIDHYGVATPIFIDNAESVTDLNLINGKAQIIRLVVSGDSQGLRFEEDCLCATQEINSETE